MPETRKSTSNRDAQVSGAKPSQIGLGKKVFLGMSGGVDSSVSAILLLEAGYDVTGVFIKVWQPDETDCGWKDERRDAMRVAALLDIPFETLDLSDVYKKEVADYMISEYKEGRTPNPDIMCNRYVKFGSFWDYAKSKGANYIATGHYAVRTENFEMHESKDTEKDQTYFLWTLTENDLEHVLFPIGHLEKKEVRKIGEDRGLPVFDKKDSQGVCFIGHLDMKEFLKSQIKTEPGNVLDTSGNIIGTHDGSILYTFGERHGFKIKNSGTDSSPRYVISKDIDANTITVASDIEFKEISNKTESEAVPLTRTNLPREIQKKIEKDGSFVCQSRIRHRQEKQDCKILISKPLNETERSSNPLYSVVFDTIQKGLAPGQSAVFYSGNRCIGGGILGE